LGLRADDQSDPGNCRAIGGATLTRMTWMTLRTIPPVALSALRAYRRCRDLIAWASKPAMGTTRQGPFPGSKFTLSPPFAPTAGFRCARGNLMWNGWKKAAIGLSALLAFVVLELVAVIGGVAVFLGLVMDVDLPFFAVAEE
jgi:hypothetical protein